jgi:hypothetical protein
MFHIRFANYPAEKNVNGESHQSGEDNPQVNRVLSLPILAMSKRTGMSPTLIQSQSIDVRCEMSNEGNEWKTVCMSEGRDCSRVRISRHPSQVIDIPKLQLFRLMRALSDLVLLCSSAQANHVVIHQTHSHKWLESSVWS